MDIEALAREAGLWAGDPAPDLSTCRPDAAARFAALVAKRALTIDDHEIRHILGADGKYGVTDGEVIDVQRVLEARRAAFPMPKG